MGNDISILIMNTSSWLLLCVISLLGSYVVLTEGLVEEGGCSCYGLENVRKLIPDGSGQAKQLLYEIWKLSEKDFCRSTFQSIPISTLGLGKRRNDMKLGTFVKQQAKELKTHAKEYFWKRWVQNQDIPMDIELKFDYVETMINNTMVMEDLERNLDREIEKKDFITETIINEMKEIFPNLDFLKSYDALNIEDVIAAVHGLACTWAPPPVNSSSASYIEHCNKRVAYTNQLFTDHPPRFTKSNLEKVLNTK